MLLNDFFMSLTNISQFLQKMLIPTVRQITRNDMLLKIVKNNKLAQNFERVYHGLLYNTGGYVALRGKN